ncbi:hypothetical protein DICPUDRAFT_79443 [Dictyostelium purpureum]|uniref:CCHC-type domain-containing protein n=1 Tax=Dictyostelium purpureum TaxID=5786 RepID=F0ZML2_DICPU|nr:uncharacterized protein DICPUDRAFT_79443 [Dictyostelium purpureum]EGC34810.1 hypothetical protein DICPUDRAFT_79443 [Dictyostelium purpureum]|eukprot:XP_003288667.1 hypothetical protein DICPUDRAFT_79443 [Dictyostelium purpureum]
MFKNTTVNKDSKPLKNNSSESSSSSDKITPTNNLSNNDNNPSGSNINTSGLGRSDEFKEYLLKEIAILKLENDRYRNQSFGYERKRKPLSEDAKFVGGFSMGFEKTWDLFEFQFRYHFGPRFDNSDLISSLKGDALIYLQRTDPNGNKTAEENLVQLRKHYQDLPTTLLLKFSEFTRTGKFESLERLLLVFDTVRTRAKLSDDAAIVTLKTALGMNFSKALMVDISDVEGYTSFQKFSEKIVRLEKNYQLTMGKSLYLRQDEIQGVFGASVSSSGLTPVVSNEVAVIDVNRNSGVKCFNCGNPNHLARECREKYNNSNRRDNYQSKYNNYNNYSKFNRNNQTKYNNYIRFSNNRSNNNNYRSNNVLHFEPVQEPSLNKVDSSLVNNKLFNNQSSKTNNNIQSHSKDSNNNNIQTSSAHINNSIKDNQQSPLDNNNNNHDDNNKSKNNNNKVEDIVKFNKYSIELLEKIDFSPQPYQKEIVTPPRPDIDFKVAQDSSIILTPQQAKFVQLKKNYSEIIPEKLKKESLAKEIFHSIPFIDGTEESKLHQAPYPVSAFYNNIS